MKSSQRPGRGRGREGPRWPVVSGLGWRVPDKSTHLGAEA